MILIHYTAFYIIIQLILKTFFSKHQLITSMNAWKHLLQFTWESSGENTASKANILGATGVALRWEERVTPTVEGSNTVTCFFRGSIDKQDCACSECEPSVQIFNMTLTWKNKGHLKKIINWNCWTMKCMYKL